MRVGLFHEAPGTAAKQRTVEHDAEQSVAAAPLRIALSAPPPASESAPGWHAQLTLALEPREGRTVLARAEHVGPLRVQRAFYPEPEGVCHLYVLHPPGGIASTDELRTIVQLAPAARALITTPGAGKLYRSRGLFAEVKQELAVGSDACLEWFPQEMIAFSGAEARLATHVELAADATYAGWEILCLGRPACGERFARGQLRNELSIRVDGQLRFLERSAFSGDDPALTEAWGLGGAPVLGTFVVAHARASEEWVELLRAEIEAREGLFAATLVSGLLVARYLGRSTLDARACFERMFVLLRPHYAARAATLPRIWRT